MADRGALGLLGLMFAGVTMAVMLVAIVQVQAHAGGYASLDPAALTMAAPLR